MVYHVTAHGEPDPAGDIGLAGGKVGYIYIYGLLGGAVGVIRCS